MKLFSIKRNIEIANALPILLNTVLICVGVFILITMSVVWGVFEEFTAFTDYTQDWIEFNFFIHYWDRLTISRVYLAFVFIYGAVVLSIGASQIHAYRKKDISLMYFSPMLLVFVATVTLLSSLSWLIVTAVNHNEGFLATGGFIFERMRFKGNVWKDLKYREQSWNLVTSNQVPFKAPILKTWVHQRERDFDCCGWNSYLDYQKNGGGFTNLPESCCKRKYRSYRCGANYLIEDITYKLNTRGCKQVMYDWYKRGFGTNIAIALLGIILAAYEFFLYSLNRRKYFEFLKQLTELKNIKEPQYRPSRTNSKTSIYTPPTPKLDITEIGATTDRPRVPIARIPMRNFYNLNNNNDNSNEEYSETNFDAKLLPPPPSQNGHHMNGRLYEDDYGREPNGTTNVNGGRIYRDKDGREEERQRLYKE